MNIHGEAHEAAVEKLLAELKKEYEEQMEVYRCNRRKYDAWKRQNDKLKKQWEEDAEQKSATFEEKEKVKIEAEHQKQIEHIQEDTEQTKAKKQREEDKLARLGFFYFGKKRSAKRAIRKLNDKLKMLECEEADCTAEYYEAISSLAERKKKKYNQLIKSAEKKHEAEFPAPTAPKKPRPMPEVRRVDPDDTYTTRLFIEDDLAKASRTVTYLIRRFPDFLSRANVIAFMSQMCAKKLAERVDGEDELCYCLGIASTSHHLYLDYLKGEVLKREIYARAGLPYDVM